MKTKYSLSLEKLFEYDDHTHIYSLDCILPESDLCSYVRRFLMLVLVPQKKVVYMVFGTVRKTPEPVRCMHSSRQKDI